jgi:ubiquinone/menaquinone biosynthesis C-methylase UbiE
MTCEPRYDRLAADYDRAMRMLERRLFGRLRERALAEIAEGSLVIEIGAGTGANFALYPKGARVAACELSIEMLKVARGKPRSEGVALVQARAEALPFADATFDAAVATLVFCSVASPRVAFAELRRVVRVGGRIVMVEHVRPRGVPGLLFDLFNPLTRLLLEDHINRRTAEEARRAGLRVLHTQSRALGIVQLIVCEV